ncbi:hypothetical protein V513_08990 [Mesotoga sp. H07.pep.5.3]|nr:hypothetical protein V513_08990 [Mesotoga sp. H07.pep.5.3]
MSTYLRYNTIEISQIKQNPVKTALAIHRNKEEQELMSNIVSMIIQYVLIQNKTPKTIAQARSVELIARIQHYAGLNARQERSILQNSIFHANKLPLVRKYQKFFNTSIHENPLI